MVSDGDRESQNNKLSEEERVRLLKIFDTLLPKVPKRPLREVEAELRDIRRARRRWGRLST